MPEYYFTDGDWPGFATRLADNILLSSKPCKGENFFDDTLFAIEIPEDVINKFELVETRYATREFLTPATLLTGYEPAAVMDDY